MGLLDWQPLAVLGVASDSLYIWHDPIVTRLATLSAIPHSYPAQLAIATAVSIAVALVSYHLIEASFLALRRQWSGARQAASSPTASADQAQAAAPPTPASGPVGSA